MTVAEIISGISWLTVAFYALSALVLVSALRVVFVKNIVHAVLWLAVCFISLAGIFITLDADFIAMVQVMVYAGAVCIMVVFGIMLIPGDIGQTNQFNKQIYAGGAVALLVTLLSGVLSYRIRFVGTPLEIPDNSVDIIATLLLSKYVMPFEVVAILLLVALVGAIFLAKEVKADGDSQC